MKRKSKLLGVALLGASLLLLLLARSAAAGYFGDGSVANPTTGNWNAPNDMVCIVGVRADGTLDIADGITNSRECIYLTRGTMNGGTPFDLTTMTTSDQCTKAGFSGNDNAKHSFATSICVDANGNGIALTDLDRTMSMCVAKGGIWKQTSATPPYPGAPGTYPTPGFAGACVAYGRQFKGQDADGNPLAFGTKGTAAADAGFCYAPLNLTTAYPTANACPANDASSHPSPGFDSTSAYDWSFSSSKCSYNKGIKGYVLSTLTKATGATVAAGTYVDFSAYTTMGQCIANGGTWNNWVGQPVSTRSIATTPNPSTVPVWDYTRQAPDADNGCLHCHSNVTQYNGPSERWKESYLKTGHKNMLRKVTPGKSWAGPNIEGDLEHYTEAATGPLNFTNATAWVTGVWRDLLYIFGDWMSPTLDVIVNKDGYGKYNGTGNYSCAACHTTGWSNASAGMCSLSSKTNSKDCTDNNGTWYPLVGVQGIGTPGYTPAEPHDSFPAIIFSSAGQWNKDGIQCARCHNAAVGKVTDTQIAASQFPSTHVTNGGMGALAAGVGRTNLCFGCHGQSVAKTNNGLGADNDLDHPENLQVRNMATAPDYLPEFGIHPIGSMFLNSPHARYSGKMVVNPLGKYDLEDPVTRNDNGNASKYSSLFQGYTCWQSSTSTSPAKTMIVDGVIKEIKTKSDCENLYGAGAWRSDLQGTCVTCHDVHNSLFVAEQRESALRKVCTDCHTNKPLTKVRHLTGLGTPLDVSEPFEACINCHMPKATDGGVRMHLWRINADADYRTFPTAEEFGIGAPATNKNANPSPNGTYANAVWVDVDYACGQCHGGSRGSGATRNGAPYIGKEGLAEVAAEMHINSGPTVSVTADVNGYTVTLTDSSSDDRTLPPNAVYVEWGDKKTDKGNAGGILSHTYSKPKKFVILYSVTDSNGAKSTKKINIVVHKDTTQAKK